MEKKRKERKKEAGSMIVSWQAGELERKGRPPFWSVVVFLVLVVILAYGLFTDNFFLSIISIITGLLIYLFEKKEPKIFKFGIRPDGILAQNHLYEFSSLRSFWIFYAVNGRKELSLKSKRGIVPFVRIPLGKANPVEIRKVLLEYLPEKKQEETWVDTIEDLM